MSTIRNVTFNSFTGFTSDQFGMNQNSLYHKSYQYVTKYLKYINNYYTPPTLCNNYVKNHLNSFRVYSTNSRSKKNHYEILNLPNNCSQNDIRDSFLKLSKKFHPDKTSGIDSHVKYLEILEAYKVLSKPLSRREYDLGLTNNFSNVHYYKTSTFNDDVLWHNRDRSRDGYYESKPYYGIKGLKKMSNSWIVLLCIAFTAIGVTLQIIAIRHSFTLSRNELNKRSMEAAEIHSQVRQRALLNGDAKQLEILKARFGINEHNLKDDN